MTITTITLLTGYAQGTTVVTSQTVNSGYRRCPVDGMIALFVAVAGFLAFDLFALQGADSREAMPDDHRR